MKVTRKRVTPSGACGRPVRSCGASVMNPECTASEGELIMAWRAPSASTVTLAEGGIKLVGSGSGPKVMVWFVTASEVVHSTVARDLACAGDYCVAVWMNVR